MWYSTLVVKTSRNVANRVAEFCIYNFKESGFFSSIWFRWYQITQEPDRISAKVISRFHLKRFKMKQFYSFAFSASANIRGPTFEKEDRERKNVPDLKNHFLKDSESSLHLEEQKVMSHSAILSKSDRFILAKLGLIFVPSVSVTQPRIVPLSNTFHPAISFFEKCPIMSVFLSCSFFLPSLFFWLWSITKWAPCPPRAFFFPSVYYGTLNSANRSRRVCDSFAMKDGNGWVYSGAIIGRKKSRA